MTTKKTKNNSLLATLDDMSEMLKDECGSLCMDEESDRARMALWIHDNFCMRDWRISMTNYFQKKPAFPGRESITGRGFPDTTNKAAVDVVIDDDDFNNSSNGKRK